MTKTLSKEKEQRAKEISRAVRDSRNLRAYVKVWFNGKSKEYIITYLIHSMQELKELYDTYNPLGKEIDDLEK